MPGFGQALAYVIVPSIPTDAFAPNVAVASPFAKLSVSAARAMPGTTAAATNTAVTQTIRNHLFPTISALPSSDLTARAWRGPLTIGLRASGAPFTRRRRDPHRPVIRG